MPAPAEGSQFGHYKLGRVIGSGGMGEVYLARDLALDRDVAIKFVTASVKTDDTLTRRLVHEAKAVALLDHPGICPVFDAGVDAEGRAFMVMQYAPGETLAARLKRGPLPPEEAVRLCSQIGEALAVAHQNGVIHRDLKPQNVILTPSGQPKIVDFGIAKVLVSSAAAEWETASALTNAYALVGTPAYMSPEQVHQRPVDGRSDLFALGAIFFECLTARRAFHGDTPLEVAGNITHAPAPVVSRVRPELGTQFDEVCARLLAKKPEDRYQSAEDAVAALQHLPDAARPIRRVSYRAVTGVATALLLVAAALAAPRWLEPRSPRPPETAQRWFTAGMEAMREGSYYGATTALQEGLNLFPEYPIAYALLAEARRELDDEAGATRELVRLSEQLPDQSRLPTVERLRLDAIRAMVLRDVDAGVRAYKQMAERHAGDPGAWIDLGRAQEAAGQLSDARSSYERSIGIDRQYATAHLRLGSVHGTTGDSAESLKAFAEAERLYRAASNTEGETEVLIRRGGLLDNFGKFQEARDTLQRALQMAESTRNPYQIVRARMHLSSARASQGQFAEAEQIASTGVEQALSAGLETAAAEGLIDLAATLAQRGNHAAAETHVERALKLAEGRGAARTAARARTQRASLHLDQQQPKQALAAVAPAIEFFRSHQYRLRELDALSVAARAYQRLDDIPKSRELATEILRVGKTIKDDLIVGQASATLAGLAVVLGSLPEALALRTETEALHRKNADHSQLPYEILNKAELLIRLGRQEDAAPLIREIEAGIVKGMDPYVGRQRRVHLLQAYSAIVTGQYSRAAKIARQIDPNSLPAESSTALGPVLAEYAEAQQSKRLPTRGISDPIGSLSTSLALQRERRYWIAAALLAGGDAKNALRVALIDLDQLHTENDELRWRLAAVAAAAARQLKDVFQYEAMRLKATDALKRLRAAWGTQAQAYEARHDLILLRAMIGQ